MFCYLRNACLVVVYVGLLLIICRAPQANAGSFSRVIAPDRGYAYSDEPPKNFTAIASRFPVPGGVRPVTVLPANDPVLNACKTKDGKDRPFPCEFQIHTIWFMGKNNEVLAKSTANGQFLKLPMSKAISGTSSSNSGTLIYNVSIDYSRINKASFTPLFYTLSKSSVTEPSSPGETKLIQKLGKISPSLPPPFTRPKRITFPLQLNFGGSGAEFSLASPPQLFQIENPVTFGKLTSTLHFLRDRAEAWRTVQLQVDPNK